MPNVPEQQPKPVITPTNVQLGQLVDEKIANENHKIFAQQHIALDDESEQETLQRHHIIARNNKIFIATGLSVALIIGAAILTPFITNQNKNAATTAITEAEITKDTTVGFETSDTNNDGTINEIDEETAAEAYAAETQDEFAELEQNPGLSDEEIVGEDAENSDATDEASADEVVQESTEPEETTLPSEDTLPYEESPDSDPSVPTTPSTPTSGSTFTIASWNTLYTNSPSSVARGAKIIANKADIIGFQELNFSTRRSALYKALVSCAGCAYSGYFPDTSGNGWGTKATLSLVWKKSRFTLLKSGTLSVLGPNAYGANTSNKWVNWVKLRDKTTGKPLYFLNTHLVATVESNGKPTGASSHLKNYAAHMDKLVGLINTFKKENVPIFISGDFNVNYRKDSSVQYGNFPYKRLGGASVTSGYQLKGLSGIAKNKGTVAGSTRLVDYVFALKKSDVYSKSIAIASSRYGSDHAASFHTVLIAK